MVLLTPSPERVSEEQVYVHLSEINGRVSIEDVGQTGSTLIWSEGRGLYLAFP
jgi:hypothetical protein